jgi:hypothetical protein
MFLPLGNKMTCKDYQAFLRKQTLLPHQLLYLVEYHMLAIQNHKYVLVYIQADLQAAEREKADE